MYKIGMNHFRLIMISDIDTSDETVPLIIPFTLDL